MKWRTIKKDNPKAFKCFEESGSLKTNQGLFDFFDTKKIYANVYIDYEISGNETIFGDWWYNVVSKGRLDDQEGFKSRNEAITAALTRAFKVLEKDNE